MKTIKLYGDGINDDFPAIQGMLDSGIPAVVLPVPEKNYLIGNTLKIHSNQSLRLERFVRIELKKGSNCLMLTNADPHGGNENVCVEGGIWDMNHSEQWPNPYHFSNPEGKKFFDYIKEIGFDKTTSKVLPPIYTGHCMTFNTIKNLCVKNITIKNPVVYGIQAAYIEQFTFSDIIFDYTEGSPKLWNMDGIHLEGGCRFGIIRNLQGACHDDLVAITSDDSLYGPISDITIEGIFANSKCHSAVRLLSHKIPVRNIRICGIYGSFYTYCVGFTKYHGTKDDRGTFENVTVENVFAQKSEGTVDVSGAGYPLIWFEGGLKVKNLIISNVRRSESFLSVPLIKIDENCLMDRCRIENIWQNSNLKEKIALVENNGEIKNLVLNNAENCCGEVYSGTGFAAMAKENNYNEGL